MRPSILVIYYSQSGQLKQILDHILSSISSQCDIEFMEIKPLHPFPFPWNAGSFFDCMPESVQQIAEDIVPLSVPNKHFDLIILGYQPWFLSPSIPISSFLHSRFAAILKNKNVVTVIGSRNMWLNAQEKVKEKLFHLQANLVGNIVLFDRNPNLISILTIIRWSFKGQKEASRYLPEAGVQKIDMEGSTRFGPILLTSIQNKAFETLHQNLLKEKAVQLKPGLVVLERRGIANFRKFSVFILKKGKRGDIARRSRVKLFQRLLFLGVFILSPISNFSAKLIVLFNKKVLEDDVQYFKSIGYKKNAI